jgi:integral membrane protein
VNAALIRYRVIAYVVGVFLLVLVFVATPLTLTGHHALGSVLGPIHGFLYIVYCVLAFHLAVLARWSLRYTLLIMLAGTVPFLSFVAERSVTRRVRDTARPDRTPASSRSA